ncbi:hypothetical protein [Halocynthiibacter namhaensis]|uniref:hypothetical protein n=1 Tax=Halocynthiibacter namhaensis TaxID=1290553 RepID=UPI0005790AD8|nr:hypothetical protein [Halocynthiibacter namhaensis]
MGGYGSGRSSYKQKAEHCRSLDVNRLHRAGSLQHGSQGSWVWSSEDAEVARVGYKTDHSRFVLNYKVRQNRGDWEPITQPIPLTYSSCHYGNQRPYFLCPGIVAGQHCGRRVGKLYSGGRYFLCRHCYNISYASQSEDRHNRMLRRANKLRTALGGEPGAAHWIAPKPKGMWERTYQRKRLKIDWCEDQANSWFIEKYAHLLGTEERAMFFDPE